MEHKHSILPWLAVAAVAAVALAFLYSRKHAQNVAMSSAQVSNPAARGLNYVANGSANVLNRGGAVGHGVSQALNAPITNITSGNVRGTAGSIITGGVSDIFPSLNPVSWF